MSFFLEQFFAIKKVQALKKKMLIHNPRLVDKCLIIGGYSLHNYKCTD
jgi:hypothetical protein